MWWRKPLVTVFALLALGLAGCGFSPLYATGGGGAESPVGADLALVRIQPIKDRIGQQLRNALLQRLTPRGEPGDYRYVLAVEINQSSADMGYRRDSFSTLGSLTMTANLSLTHDGIILVSGTARTVVYFDYLGPRYASVAMERDAEERGVTQLADDIRSQVAAAIAQYKVNPKDPRFRRSSEQDSLRPLKRPERP